MTRIYLAQLEPILGNKKRNLEKMHSFIKEASFHHADLVLFPELALTGLSNKNKTKELAESTEDSSMIIVEKWAKDYNIKVVFGFPELVDNNIYDSACFINNDGELIGVHRKVHLWGEEERYFTPGDRFNVWKTDIGKVGIMICYDTQFPEAARLLALQEADMIVVPTGNMSPFETLQPFNIQSRAEENQIFVCATNLVGIEDSINFFGESTVADPCGKILTQIGQSESGVPVDIHIQEVTNARKRYNYLADRRPELYKGLGKGKWL